MNIALALMHLYPHADPMRDFVVRDNGPEPVLRAGAEEKGRVRYEIKQVEAGVKPVEGIHYRYGIDYDLLIFGEDYEMVERGPYISVWNLPVPQPSTAQLEAAWSEMQSAPAPLPPETDAEKIIRLEARASASEAAILALMDLNIT